MQRPQRLIKLISNGHWFHRDTTLVNGFTLNYYETTDSCCVDDVYIRWSGNSMDRIFVMESVRLMRSYFLPYYLTHNSEYIVLEHGCSTSCHGLIYLPQNKFEKIKGFQKVYFYESALFDYVLTGDYDGENHIFTITNIKTGKAKDVRFQFPSRYLDPINSIDTFYVTNSEIRIRGLLVDRDNQKDTTEFIRIKKF